MCLNLSLSQFWKYVNIDLFAFYFWGQIWKGYNSTSWMLTTFRKCLKLSVFKYLLVIQCVYACCNYFMFILNVILFYFSISLICIFNLHTNILQIKAYHIKIFTFEIIPSRICSRISRRRKYHCEENQIYSLQDALTLSLYIACTVMPPWGRQFGRSIIVGLWNDSTTFWQSEKSSGGQNICPV